MLLALLQAALDRYFGLNCGIVEQHLRYFFYMATVFAVSAFAQDSRQGSPIYPSFRAPIQFDGTFDLRKHANAYFLKSASATPSFRRSWYWETITAGSGPSAADRYLPVGTKASQPDFAPASLRWSFTGKHKVIPVIDLTVTKFKPGEKSFRGEPSSKQPSENFWTKATHSISELLH
jgi:hypothetical protein